MNIDFEDVNQISYGMARGIVLSIGEALNQSGVQLIPKNFIQDILRKATSLLKEEYQAIFQLEALDILRQIEEAQLGRN